MKKAYSYIRISSAIQAQGDGLRRQQAETERACQLHGWTLQTTKFADKGVSAFDASNLGINRGLGRLLSLIESGAIEPGSVIVIEALDRLSRATPLDALSLITRIVSSGVEVYTTIDNQHFTRQRLNTDPSCLFITLGQLIRGRDESEKKSNRSKAWVNNRKASGKHYTTRNPYWIKGNPIKDVPYELISSRVAAVKEVYRLAKLGYGAVSIVGILNKSDDFKRDDGKQWYPSSITNFLQNSACYGAMKTLDGNVVPDYYPAIMTYDEWLSVRALVDVRKKKTPKSSGNNPHSTANLFTQRIYCQCGSALKFSGTEDFKGADTRSLKCLSATTKVCDAELVSYSEIEYQILYIIYVHLGGRFEEVVGETREKATIINKKLIELGSQIGNLTTAIEQAASPTVINMLVPRLEKFIGEQQELRAELERLNQQSVSIKHDEDRRGKFDFWYRGIKDLNNDVGRREIMNQIKLMINRITISKLFRISDKINTMYGLRDITINGDLTSGEDYQATKPIKMSVKMRGTVRNRLGVKVPRNR